MDLWTLAAQKKMELEMKKSEDLKDPSKQLKADAGKMILCWFSRQTVLFF